MNDIAKRLRRRAHNFMKFAPRRENDVVGPYRVEEADLDLFAAAEIERLQEEKAVAIKLMADASRAQGVAEGKLAGSELAGVVEGWRERAERAEAEAERLRAALKSVRAAERPPVIR